MLAISADLSSDTAYVLARVAGDLDDLALHESGVERGDDGFALRRPGLLGLGQSGDPASSRRAQVSSWVPRHGRIVPHREATHTLRRQHACGIIHVADCNAGYRQ